MPAAGRFGTDRAATRDMLKLSRQHAERVWAVEGCNGIGRHLTECLLADGETGVNVPAKRSAWCGYSPSGRGRKERPGRRARRRSGGVAGLGPVPGCRRWRHC
jgi:hypothetical protein